ncbi:hypothetical protein CYMTET_14348 [Cymbomonas tetramitiformis]|uniref:Probable transcriptional regulator ycf27 n=1 Tax=Cymbomonas tetramitiformis TaxID=36881 RepID=A0AAE0GGI8_9CHLO|nr:hypothetical protein CYMTET_14348 [Cymbomonas tetramitiformis]
MLEKHPMPGTGFVQAVTLMREEEPSLVVIDVDQAHFDGYNVFKTLRRVHSVRFILLITAEDLIAKAGDDAVELALTEYMIKPFTPQELEVRCRQALTHLAICRQSQNPALYSSDGVANIIELGDIQIDTVKRRVYKGNMVVPLTNMEYTLLELLASQGIDEPVTRHTIVEELYGADPHEIDPCCITVHVCRLRKKLDKKLIQTRRGVGYQLKVYS